WTRGSRSCRSPTRSRSSRKRRRSCRRSSSSARKKHRSTSCLTSRRTTGRRSTSSCAPTTPTTRGCSSRPRSVWRGGRRSWSTAGDRDPLAQDRNRYYRLVIPQEPEKPVLSPHPLTWTTISHVIWDGLDPEVLNVGQQQAMLDWLHWGGQIIVAGGAASSFTAL